MKEGQKRLPCLPPKSPGQMKKAMAQQWSQQAQASESSQTAARSKQLKLALQRVFKHKSLRLLFTV